RTDGRAPTGGARSAPAAPEPTHLLVLGADRSDEFTLPDAVPSRDRAERRLDDGVADPATGELESLRQGGEVDVVLHGDLPEHHPPQPLLHRGVRGRKLD